MLNTECITSSKVAFKNVGYWATRIIQSSLIVALWSWGLGLEPVQAAADDDPLGDVRTETSGTPPRPPANTPPPTYVRGSAQNRVPSEYGGYPTDPSSPYYWPYPYGYNPYYNSPFHTRTIYHNVAVLHRRPDLVLSDPSGASSPKNPPSAAHYRGYPYQDGGDGYVKGEPAEYVEKDEFAGRLRSEGGYVFGGVWRVGLGLNIRIRRFGIDSDLHFFVDQHLRDALYLGATNLTYSLVMKPKVVWRFGGGANYMFDGRRGPDIERRHDIGPNFTTALDLYLVKPLVLSGQFDIGRIGLARTIQAKGTVGLLLRRWELFGGYDFRQVGDVALHGPTAGLRLWM